MKWISTIFVMIIFMSPLSHASLELGVGQNSTFSGRLVPAITAGITTSGNAYTFYSTGVQNDFYYQSVYGLHYFRQKQTGNLLGGEVVCGLGLGLMYAQRGFKDLNSSSERTKSDMAFGPAFRVNWTIFPRTFINFDATYGLRDFGSHLLLNFQDVITFSAGFRFW